MSKIQWTDVTDNPIIVKGGGWYCTKVSEGCQHCYAEVINQSSYYGGNGLKYRHQKDQPELELRRDLIASWARQRKPKKHFVASMTDVFGEFVPDEWIFELLDAMTAAPLQTFQVLTKRAELAAYMIAQWVLSRGLEGVPENIWIGVSVEDQKRADERIPWLLKIDAPILFLSCEPLLGPISLKQWFEPKMVSFDLRHPDWVIIGGESGPNARPMSLDWANRIDAQCRRAGVAVFWKQLGAVQVQAMGLKDPKGGDIDEWPMGLGRREFPEVIRVESPPELVQASLL